MEKLKSIIAELPFSEEIIELGGNIYLVGGLVRDYFLEKESKDIDIIINNIELNDLKTILCKYGNIDIVGESFGVIKFRWGDLDLDISLPRQESSTGRGHKDFIIDIDPYMSIEEEMKRRDFTINAMALKHTGDLIDPFDGLSDIKSRTIRMVNPDAFKEDPLRMMRAIQFTSRFGFRIDTTTWESILDNAPSIREISGERITIELDKIFHKGNKDLGLFLFEASTLKFRIFGHNPKMHMIKRGHNTRADFFTNMAISPDEFLTILKGDVKTKKLMDAIKFVRTGIDDMDVIDFGTIRMVLAKAHAISDDVTTSSIVIKKCGSFITDMNNRKLPWTLKDLDICGHDIMGLGFKGQQIGEAFQLVHKAVLSDEISNTKTDIIQFLKR